MTEYWSRYIRTVLSDKPLLLCPSCYGECLKIFSYDLLEFYSTKCGICDTPLGFVKGYVKARKLGSYIRLTDKKRKQVSIDISSFGNDFDVRKDDEVTLVYQLNYRKRLPVMLINHTINEAYYTQAYKAPHLFDSKNREIVDLEEFREHLLFPNMEDTSPEIKFVDVDRKADIHWIKQKV